MRKSRIYDTYDAFSIFKNNQFGAKIGKPADTFLWDYLDSTNFQKKKSLCFLY